MALDKDFKTTMDEAIRMCDAENKITSGMLSQLRETLKRYKTSSNRKKLVNQYIDNVNKARASGKVSEEEYNSFVKKAEGMI